MRTLFALARVVVLVLVAVLVGSITWSCGHALPGTTPQAAVAHYGTDLVKAVTKVQGVIITATETNPPALSASTAEPIMDKIFDGLKNAQRASNALKVYDAAATAVDKRDKVLEISGYLNAVIAGIGNGFADKLPPGAAADATRAVTEVVQIVTTVRTLLAIKDLGKPTAVLFPREMLIYG